jgi:DNA/RNA-binding domain of Phe-tRNA-synthetase-like protein
MFLNVAPDLLEMGLSASAVVARDVDNTHTPPVLMAYRRDVAHRLAAFWRNRSVAAHPAIREYHRVHELFGAVEEPSAPEKLLMYVRRHRDFPSAGAIVDCYNIVSTNTMLGIGAHDFGKLSTPVTLRRCTSDDVFVPLGETEEHRLPGEYGYVDPQGRIICRLEVLQCDYSKVTRESRHVVFFLQGNRCLSAAVLLKGSWLLAEMIEAFCGGTAEIVDFFDARPAGLIGLNKPQISHETFNQLNLYKGTALRAVALPDMAALSVVTVRVHEEVEALAPSSTLPESLAGQSVIVATGLHPVTLAGKRFSAYVLSTTAGPGANVLRVESAIPDGQKLS